MSSQVIIFEAPAELIATVDEIASIRSVDRAAILLDALAEYLAEYQNIQANVDEGYRQLDAGETVPHEEMVAWLNARQNELAKSEAA